MNPESRIKNGLTANIKIQTDKKSDVLTLPLYAITKEGDEVFVNKIVAKGKKQKTPITLGLTSNDGTVEILSGLEEGDIVEF